MNLHHQNEQTKTKKIKPIIPPTEMKMQKLSFRYYKSIKKMHKINNVEGVAESIATDIVKMVFGRITHPVSTESLNSDLAQFTTGEERQNANRAVWKDGNSRYPHINRVTGMVALYENPQVLQLARSSEILDVFRKQWFGEVENADVNVGERVRTEGLKKSKDSDRKTKNFDPHQQLTYTHGPPIPIVKPSNSGKSPGIIFTLQDTSPGLKYSGLLCLTGDGDVQGSKKSNTQPPQHTGELQRLANFELYYELFDAFYNFQQHTRANDIIYLDWGDKKTGFNVNEANQIIEEYTSLYNYYVRGIPSTLHREVRWEVAKVFGKDGVGSGNKGKDRDGVNTGNNQPPKNSQSNKSRPVVPEQMKPLFWETIEMSRGDLYIFTSRDVVRTLQNEGSEARIYLHFALEPKPAGWDSSEQKRTLKASYETGQFGNWAKPGLRFYLRENSTEHRWRHGNGGDGKERRQEKEVVRVMDLPEEERSIFGV